MPCRLAGAIVLAIATWTGLGQADPADSSPAEPTAEESAPAGEPPGALPASPGGGPTVPPLPAPRLELKDPSRRRPDEDRPTYEPDPSWLGEGAPLRGFEPPFPAQRWEEPAGPPVVGPLPSLEPPSVEPPSLEPPSEAGEPAGSSVPPSVDDRSAWARWNASLWGVSATIVAFEISMVAAFTLLPTDVTGWHEPQFNGLRKNFTEGPRVDNDRFFFNYVAHPLSGSEYYIVGRNRGLNWWQSTLFSFAHSTFFEFFIESAYEQASWQDIWITPVAGTVVGELRWQVKKALENPYTGKPVGTLNKILYVVIDPFDAVYKL